MPRPTADCQAEKLYREAKAWSRKPRAQAEPNAVQYAISRVFLRGRHCCVSWRGVGKPVASALSVERGPVIGGFSG